jgi:hypothetical protein
MPVLNHELNGLVRFMGGLVPHSYTASQYPDYDAMRADYLATGRLKINTEFSTNTVFGDPVTNWFFRAWHDYCHIKANADFSPTGEHLAYWEMLTQLAEYNSETNAFTNEQIAQFVDIIHAEVIGQGDYYRQFGKFPDNQYEFVLAYLANGNKLPN